MMRPQLVIVIGRMHYFGAGEGKDIIGSIDKDIEGDMLEKVMTLSVPFYKQSIIPLLRKKLLKEKRISLTNFSTFC